MRTILHGCYTPSLLPPNRKRTIIAIEQRTEENNTERCPLLDAVNCLVRPYACQILHHYRIIHITIMRRRDSSPLMHATMPTLIIRCHLQNYLASIVE